MKSKGDRNSVPALLHAAPLPMERDYERHAVTRQLPVFHQHGSLSGTDAIDIVPLAIAGTFRATRRTSIHWPRRRLP